MASEIVDFLLRKRVWIFADRTPYVRRLEQGDRLIIYLAGRTRAFVAEARVDSMVLPLEMDLKEEVQALGLTWFTKYVRISGIRYLRPPRPIRDILPKLKFVSDKVNYGLSLRQGIRRLEVHDTKLILE